MLLPQCEVCSMDGIYKESVKGVDHFYCSHHKTDTAVLVIGESEKNIVQELAPLFLVVVAVSVVASLRHFTDFLWMSYMMDWMGIFLVVFGGFKLLDIQGFVEGFASYDVIAKRYPAYGYVFPFIEILLGTLYLLGFMFLVQNVAVLLLSLLGMYSAYAVITNKLEVRCVCLGSLFHIPMTWATFVENTLMVVMVGIMLLL